MLGYLRPHRATAAVLTPVLVAATVAELLPPLVIQHIVDDALTPGAGYGRLATLLPALVGARLLIWSAQVGRLRLAARLGAGVTADLRRDLHHRLTRLPMSFYDHRPAGSLMSRMVKDTETIQQFLAEAVPSLLLNILLLTGILVFLVVVSPTLTVVVLLPVPFLVAGAILFWRWLRRGWEGQLAAWSRLATRLHESLRGIRVVKTFGAEAGEVARFARRNEELARAATSADRRSFAFFTSVQLLMGLGLILVWYVGGRQVLSGDLTLGQLLAVTAYLWMLYWPLQWFGQVNGWVTQALTGAERIFAVLDTPGEQEAAQAPATLSSPKGRVVFRGVSFGYQPGHRVLHDIDVEIAPGQIVGMVGASGAGKTTLMNLLCRFYDPEAGSICLDGVDISRLPLAELRNQIGVVAQEPFLFSGTVADNIGYGRPTATFAEIMQAARVANVHAAVLAHVDGYDTEVGEGGRRLSGGQRQRVAIARAVLRDPKILILDEATSSVDPRSERLIQDALHRLARRRTTFIIAHRPSTLRHVDTVVVLETGRIVETGPYHQLLARRGHLWNLLHTHTDRAVGEANSTMERELDSESRNREIDRRDPSMARGTPPLAPHQVRLFRDVTGSLRMDVFGGPSYRHITVVRARPLSDPDHHIVLLDENGDELCLAADLLEFDLASRDIVEEELRRRYLRSVVRRIRSLRADGDARYVTVETDRGPRRFVVHHLDESARWLGNGRLLLVDEDGNRYEVARAEALKRLGMPEPL